MLYLLSIFDQRLYECQGRNPGFISQMWLNFHRFFFNTIFNDYIIFFEYNPISYSPKFLEIIISLSTFFIRACWFQQLLARLTRKDFVNALFFFLFKLVLPFQLFKSSKQNVENFNRNKTFWKFQSGILSKFGCKNTGLSCE